MTQGSPIWLPCPPKLQMKKRKLWENDILFKITLLFGVKLPQNSRFLNLPKTLSSILRRIWLTDSLDYYLWLDQYQEQFNQTHTHIFQIVHPLLSIGMGKSTGTDIKGMCVQKHRKQQLYGKIAFRSSIRSPTGRGRRMETHMWPLCGRRSCSETAPKSGEDGMLLPKRKDRGGLQGGIWDELRRLSTPALPGDIGKTMI